jgi:serine/threonine protein kinase
MKKVKDDSAKDQFGITNKLRSAINKKYEVVELIGNGSYGCVSQAKCRKTGRMVALKIMKSEATMEYEIIKLLREVQLMRRLNNLSN